MMGCVGSTNLVLDVVVLVLDPVSVLKSVLDLVL